MNSFLSFLNTGYLPFFQANRLLDDVGISPPILFSVLIAVLAAAHQLRVHLQFLGYPIANDPVYSGERIWVLLLFELLSIRDLSILG